MNIFVHKILDVYNVMKKKEVAILPSYISFYILLSFVPLLSLILVTLSIIDKNNHNVLLFLKDVFPQNVYLLISQFISYYNNVNAKVLTINNLILLYLSSRIYFSIYHSNTILYKNTIKRNFIFDKLIALGNTVLILLTVVILAIVLILGSYLNQFIETYFDFVMRYSEVVRIVFTFVFLNLFTSVLMLSLPKYKYNVKRVFKGAIVSAILIMFTTYSFKLYVDLYSDYDNIYYTFSTIIVFILWIYFISYSLLIGMIVNYLDEKN